jgi:hypothetical protein
MMRPKKLEHLSLASLFNLISHFRVRPEPTWVEQISVATNALPYLASLSVMKKCYNIDTRSKCGMRLAVFAGDDELDLELFLFSFSSWKKWRFWDIHIFFPLFATTFLHIFKISRSENEHLSHFLSLTSHHGKTMAVQIRWKSQRVGSILSQKYAIYDSTPSTSPPNDT